MASRPRETAPRNGPAKRHRETASSGDELHGPATPKRRAKSDGSELAHIRPGCAFLFAGQRRPRVTRAILGENARVLSDAASGIVVSQTARVISLIGVRDIVVVDTDDALLVTTSEHAQRVKGVVDALKLNGRGDVL